MATSRKRVSRIKVKIKEEAKKPINFGLSEDEIEYRLKRYRTTIPGWHTGKPRLAYG